MSKRNTESLRSFFNRCSEHVHGFDPMTVEIQPYLGGGAILCKRGDLYLTATLDDEFEVVEYGLCLDTGPCENETLVDPQIARWLLKRTRTAQSNLEAEDKVFRGTDAACQGVLSGDLPQEHKTMASRTCREARDRLNEAARAFETEAKVLGKYVAECAWGNVGNCFIGRRRSSWDGHHASRLVVQGRTVCIVVTDKHNETTRVRVLSEAEAETAFQDERTARQEREAAYNRELKVARDMVRRWKNGDNSVKFVFHNGQEGGYITFEHEGKTLVVSARGAGIDYGFDPEFGYPSATSADLREYDREQDFESAVQRGGLWRSPETTDYKVRIAGQWFGCRANAYAMNDKVEGVGRVQAIARG